jgi:disulfide bond formation protein DsbB
MSRIRTPSMIALAVGGAALALLVGALGFEYLDRLPPCEMCMWQRYPHVGAAIVGIGGFLMVRLLRLPESVAAAIALIAALLVAVSGAIGVYHAGVEWQLWPGPQACTGAAFHASGPLDLNAPVVRCDRAAWPRFGISLAGYQAVLSLAIAAAGLYFVAGTKRPS